ncbi:MAG: leucine-rich repeat domain-containing protein [Alphaproteobacteria bacterium]|nr:leucine-rich repeat domain-containing protein [Alphaproteobacteria bacterium]
MKKWIFVLSLVLSFNAYASSSGDCGAFDEQTQTYDDCHWSLDDDGHLKIWGTGKMRDYKSGGEEAAPWGWDFTSLEMDGITSIGARAFYFAPNFSSVVVPSSVEVIGTAAFQGAKQLSEVTFEEGSKLKTIADGAFNADPNLKSFDIPDGVTLIGHNAFNMSSIDYLVLPDSVFSVDDVEADAEAGYFHGLSFFGLSDVSNVFCSEAMQTECEKYFNNEESMFWEKGTYYPLKSKSSLAIYTSDGDKFYVNGKWYDSLSDMNKGRYNVKRIYTIDEANKVTGTKNRVSIKYR